MKKTILLLLAAVLLISCAACAWAEEAAAKARSAKRVSMFLIYGYLLVLIDLSIDRKSFSKSL